MYGICTVWNDNVFKIGWTLAIVQQTAGVNVHVNMEGNEIYIL